jgi:hypothetical protein
MILGEGGENLTQAHMEQHMENSPLCSGQLIPDSNLRFSSATTGGMPPLNE